MSLVKISKNKFSSHLSIKRTKFSGIFINIISNNEKPKNMHTYQLIVLFLYITIAKSDDWTSSCPSSCVCKWSNGKKTVQCNALQLTTIPTTLNTEIQVVSLNDNNIAYINREEFTTLGLINLQRIYLKKSNIVYIHRDAFKNLKILVELDLSENSIESLDKQTFNGNDRLRILYLYGNPLKQLIAYQFPVLPHLRSLDLHNCQISSIDATAFANLELLELLNLKNNLIESVSEHVFSYMKNLKTLVLEGNPWKCNCKLRKFRNWYMKSNLNSLSLTCRSPFVFRNKQWEDVDEIQFGCPPKVDIFSDDIYNVDIGSNITFGCLIYGDPLPAASWDFNGREFDNENALFEEDIYTDTLWRNLTIFNITNFDAGVYVCSAKNNVGSASKNISIFLTEIVQHVIDKGPETFWYFGLILGTFGTVFGLIIISFLVCLCKKSTERRRTIKNIKGSVSFNDQEKKLLDLSITTNERQDSCEIAHTPSTTKTESVLALEPVQITIENINNRGGGGGCTTNEEFPLNVGVFPPPPEFCTTNSSLSAGSGLGGCTNGLVSSNGQQASANPAYGNIFISVSLTPDTIDNQDLNIYPDLLNIPNRVIGKLFPVNVSSYATLPRNTRNRSLTNPTTNAPNCNNGAAAGHHHHTTTSTSSTGTNNAADVRLMQNIINYQNLETSHLSDLSSNVISLCAGCLKNQDQYVAAAAAAAAAVASVPPPPPPPTSTTSMMIKCEELDKLSKLYPIYDNMGRRITASGNSTLSLPEENEDEMDSKRYNDNDDEDDVDEQRQSIVVHNRRHNHHLHHHNNHMQQQSAQSQQHQQHQQQQQQHQLQNQHLKETTEGTGVSTMAATSATTSLLPPGCDYVSL